MWKFWVFCHSATFLFLFYSLSKNKFSLAEILVKFSHLADLKKNSANKNFMHLQYLKLVHRIYSIQRLSWIVLILSREGFYVSWESMVVTTFVVPPDTSVSLMRRAAVYWGWCFLNHPNLLTNMVSDNENTTATTRWHCKCSQVWFWTV